MTSRANEDEGIYIDNAVSDRLEFRDNDGDSKIALNSEKSNVLPVNLNTVKLNLETIKPNPTIPYVELISLREASIDKMNLVKEEISSEPPTFRAKNPKTITDSYGKLMKEHLKSKFPSQPEQKEHIIKKMGSKILANCIIQSIREDDKNNQAYDQISLSSGRRSRENSISEGPSSIKSQKTSQVGTNIEASKENQFSQFRYIEIPIYLNSKHQDNALGIIVIEPNNTLGDIKEMILKELEVEDGFSMMRGDFPIPKGQFNKKAFYFFANSEVIALF